MGTRKAILALPLLVSLLPAAAAAQTIFNKKWLAPPRATVVEEKKAALPIVTETPQEANVDTYLQIMASPTIDKNCGELAKIEGTDTLGILSLPSGAYTCTVTFSKPYEKQPVCLVSSNKYHTPTIAVSTEPGKMTLYSQEGFGGGYFYETIQYACFAR